MQYNSNGCVVNPIANYWVTGVAQVRCRQPHANKGTGADTVARESGRQQTLLCVPVSSNTRIDGRPAAEWTPGRGPSQNSDFILLASERWRARERANKGDRGEFVGAGPRQFLFKAARPSPPANSLLTAHAGAGGRKGGGRGGGIRFSALAAQTDGGGEGHSKQDKCTTVTQQYH
jgi:hypothetical protein